MKQYMKSNSTTQIVNSLRTDNDRGRRWTLMEKLFMGLTLQQYIAQAIRNPFNWFLALIFAVGFPVIIGRFIFGLEWATGGPQSNAWGLFLGFGLFGMGHTHTHPHTPGGHTHQQCVLVS